MGAAAPGAQTKRPRLGFLGVGWIGRHRMEAIVASGVGEVAVIAEPSRDLALEAARLAPEAALVSTLDELLDIGVDGVVIATPSALHAEQSIRALERGAAVFCQKPLGRTTSETQAVLRAAHTADRLLGVDFSYRFTAGAVSVRDIIRSGGIGRVYAADLVFHNAYGPDKAWFYEPALSGGGCVMDLGVHLVDLALWALDFPEVTDVSARLFANGELLSEKPTQVEDYAVAELQLDTGTAVRMACSWKLSVGCDAVISAAFFGTQGGLALRNVGGSFYDFTAERYAGTTREILTLPPDDWGGRAAVNWACRLAAGAGFDAGVEGVAAVSAVLDRIYGR